MNLLYIRIYGNLGAYSLTQGCDFNTLPLQYTCTCNICACKQMLHTHKIGMYGIRHGKAGNAIPIHKNTKDKLRILMLYFICDTRHIGDCLRSCILLDWHIVHIL